MVIQFGPQQLKYMTVLKDSSPLLSFNLVETRAEEEDERVVFAWDMDLTWFLSCCWAFLMTKFHLHTPNWSFNASTAPTLAATIHDLLILTLMNDHRNTDFD